MECIEETRVLSYVWGAQGAETHQEGPNKLVSVNILSDNSAPAPPHPTLLQPRNTPHCSSPATPHTAPARPPLVLKANDQNKRWYRLYSDESLWRVENVGPWSRAVCWGRACPWGAGCTDWPGPQCNLAFSPVHLWAMRCLDETTNEGRLKFIFWRWSLWFHELRRAELELDQQPEATVSQTDAAAPKVELLKNTLLPQVHILIWDDEHF